MGENPTGAIAFRVHGLLGAATIFGITEELPMSSLIIAAALLAANDLTPLQGTWTNNTGTEIVIKDDEVSIRKDGEEEFAGYLGIPKAGTLQVIIGGEVALEMPYRVAGDKLTITIDGTAVEYKRKPVIGVG